MKIVAGLGSLDEYIRFCNAGADEFFAGYVPYEWNKKYGTVLPLNRREVFCSNVQLGSFSELEILAAMVKKYKKPVHLTFNALYYIPRQYPEIAGVIRQCMELGYRSYILADPALILYLRAERIDCEIHLSGETSEVNSRMFAVFKRQQIRRLIFHRKNSFDDMKRVVEAKTGEEFEAFVLNELCHFTGAFCNSLHCDEMGYLCRVPYQLGGWKTGAEDAKMRETEARETETKEREAREREAREREAREREAGEKEAGKSESEEEADGYLCGATGCGLCSLYRLQKTGITHLKLVGRGNYTDFMEQDIRNLRKALEILEHSDSNERYQKTMKQMLFPNGCSGNCYCYDP